MDRKLIAIDMDETLNEYDRSFLNFLNKNYNTKKSDGSLYVKEDLKGYNIWSIIPLPEGVTDPWEPFREFAKEGYLSKLDIKPGAKEAVSRLSENHNLMLITNRAYGDSVLRYHLRKETDKWLELKGLKEHIKQCIFTEESHEKINICKSIGVDILIEDKLDTVESAAKEGIISLLLDQPWNRKGKSKSPEEENQNIYRMKDWNEIYTFIAERYNQELK